MTNENASFGRTAANLVSNVELLDHDQKAGVTYFDEHDRHLSDLVSRGLCGEKIVEVVTSRDTQRLRLPKLQTTTESWIDERFSLQSQQKKGAWYLPEDVSLKAGLVNLAWHFQIHPRFAVGAALDERARVTLVGSPEALLVWAVLEPLSENVFMPLLLRGEPKVTKARDD